MSKQTNAFQKLIHHIHSNTENTDTKVTESASLIENNIPEPIAREVDILIEKTLLWRGHKEETYILSQIEFPQDI